MKILYVRYISDMIFRLNLQNGNTTVFLKRGFKQNPKFQLTKKCLILSTLVSHLFWLNVFRASHKRVNVKSAQENGPSAYQEISNFELWLELNNTVKTPAAVSKKRLTAEFITNGKILASSLIKVLKNILTKTVQCASTNIFFN